MQLRINKESSSSEPKLAAAEAFAQGNSRSKLPLDFTYNCLADLDLELVVARGGILADAALDILAKSLAMSSKADRVLEGLAVNGASMQLKEAASLALGIRWVTQTSISVQSGNITVNGIDAIKEITNRTGTPIAAAYSLAIAHAWAGQPLDTAGHCIRVGGVSDCILTRLQNQSATLLPNTGRTNRSVIQPQDAETTYKVITDQEIRDFVTLTGRSAEGLDVLPLSSAAPGGIMTMGAVGSFSSGLPLGRVDARSFEWTNAYVHNTLLEEGFRGDLEGALAEYFEFSEDGEHIILRLRQGVTWSDGIPFTSLDVVFSAQLALHCIHVNDKATGQVSLQPFLDSEIAAFYSTDGSCHGLPAVLTNSSFISPGPDGKIDSIPLGDDFLFGNRILPAASPLSITESGNNTIVESILDTQPLGDDEVIVIGANELAIIWKGFLADAQSLASNLKFCCLPRHILASSFDAALTENDPHLILGRWDLAELRETPSTFVGTGPYILEEFGWGSTRSIIYSRNPRYWKVDQLGGRLPKLDGLHFIEFTGRREALLQAYLDGQLDILLPQPIDKVLLQSSMTERSIEYFVSDRPSTDRYIITALNSDVDRFDPLKEALAVAFRNPEVRRAISQATDRRSITEILQADFGPAYVGSRPQTRDIASPTCPISTHFADLQEFCVSFQMVKEMVAFDLAAANARLDAIGLTERTPDGIRVIPSGFGFILPGPNGILDSIPSDDDFILAGLEVSGLGLSDRDGDGTRDPDPGIIQPGRNGVLDTLPLGDDVAEISSLAGVLSYDVLLQYPGNDINEQPQFIQLREDFEDLGVEFSISTFVSFIDILQRILFSNPPAYEASVIRVGGTNLSFSIQQYFGSCAPIHIYKRSDCLRPEAREPYQVRIDELGRLASQATDEYTRARLHAELQLLQAANMPWQIMWSGRSLGSIRQDKLNAPAIPQGEAILFFSDILFRLDLQD